MWLPRLSVYSNTNKYYKTKEFNKGLGTDNDIPNCTQDVVCRSYEASNVDKPYIMFKGRGAGGYPVAKNFFDETILPKGYDLKEGSIAVFDGNCGHVAFVEQVIDDTHAIISQSQYDPNKSLRNYKYFETREVSLVVGQTSMSGIGALIGFIYIPFKDNRTSRDRTKHQVEIIEDMVNVRTAPEGTIFSKGLYAPQGIFNVLEERIVNDYKWFEIGENLWVREGEWLKNYSVSNDEYYKNLYWQEVEENKKLKSQLDDIRKLTEY